MFFFRFLFFSCFLSLSVSWWAFPWWAFSESCAPLLLSAHTYCRCSRSSSGPRKSLCQSLHLFSGTSPRCTCRNSGERLRRPASRLAFPIVRCIVGMCSIDVAPLLGCLVLSGILALVLLIVSYLLCSVPVRLASLDAWLPVSVFRCFSVCRIFFCLFLYLLLRMFLGVVVSDLPLRLQFISRYPHFLALFGMYCLGVFPSRERCRNLRLDQP